MNFFPGIYETKRAKKATSFSNPLTGALYSNREFLKNCKNVPKSISDLDHIKQIKHELNNDQSFRQERKLSERRQNLDTTERKRIQREIIAVHATSRMAQPVSKTFNEGFVIKNKCKKALDSDTLEHIQQSKMNKTFGSTRFSALSHHQMSRLENKKSQMIRQTNSNGVATFNDIQILILDLLTEKQDFRTKIIRINLQKYFRSFFKKQLSGHFTYDFLNKVQYYIEELLFQEKLDEKIEQHLYPIQLFTISSRMVFINKLLEFEARKTASNQDNIRTMIRFYCIPSKEFRESCLRDILLMLSIQVYEKFNLSRQQEYILLDQNGQQITQILQVKFSTKKLFLTSKKNSAKNYTNYIKLLDEYYREGKKLSFTENIKMNFRQRLAEGKVDESHFNYTENYEMEKIKRLMELDTAEHILKKRIETHRLNKFTPKEEFIMLNERNERNESKNKSRQKFQPVSSETVPVESTNNLPQISKYENSSNNQFWRMSDTRISPEAKPRSSSPSPQRRTRSPIKTQASIRASSQLSKQKFKEFIRQTKTNSLNASIEKNIREEFKDLVSKNDIYDFRFNHNFKNRVMKAVLKDLFVYFNNKSDLQINKIMKAVKEMDVKLDEQLGSKVNEDLESGKNDQSLIPESISQNQYENTFSQKQRVQQLENSLSWQEFRNLRIAVGCSQPKQVIMNFVAKYLNFNQFGQLSKDQLFTQVQIILGEKTQQPTVEVIAQVIWSWFQANSIIENGCIRRITLQSWYEKYKIVYCMLTSLIFGTNHKTILDLAYQVLA